MENNFRKKRSHSAEKKTKGGPFSLDRYCMLREKKRKPFLVQFAGPKCSIWRLPLFCSTFGRTILVTSGVSKKNTEKKP